MSTKTKIEAETINIKPKKPIGKYYELPEGNEGFIACLLGAANAIYLSFLTSSQKKDVSVNFKGEQKKIEIDTGPTLSTVVLTIPKGKEEDDKGNCEHFGLYNFEKAQGAVLGQTHFMGALDTNGFFAPASNNGPSQTILEKWNSYWEHIFETPDSIPKSKINHKDCDNKTHKCDNYGKEVHGHLHFNTSCGCEDKRGDPNNKHRCRQCGGYIALFEGENKFIEALSREDVNQLCGCCATKALEQKFCECSCGCDCCRGKNCGCPCKCDTSEILKEYLVLKPKFNDITKYIIRHPESLRSYSAPTPGLYHITSFPKGLKIPTKKAAVFPASRGDGCCIVKISSKLILHIED